MVKIGQYYNSHSRFGRLELLPSDSPKVLRIPKSKISYINFYFLYAKFGIPSTSFANSWMRKKSDKYFFYRWWKISPGLTGLRVGVYVGNKFHSFRVRFQAIGSYFGTFVRTRKIPINPRFKKKDIHRSKKNSSKSSGNTTTSKKVSKRK